MYGGFRSWLYGLHAVECRMYSTTNKKWQSDTSVPLRELPSLDGLHLPPFSKYQELRVPVCTSASVVGAQLLRDALQAGGEQAQASLAVIALLDCNSALAADPIWKAFTRVSGVKYLPAIAAAGNATGIAGCITHVALIGETLVDVERAAFGSPAPRPGSGEGLWVAASWNWERCGTYNATDGSFVTDLSVPPLEQPPASAVPLDIEYQSMIEQLCTQGAGGAALLAKAFAAGGEQARRAYAAVRYASCPGDPDAQAVRDAWNVLTTYSKEFGDPATAWSYWSSFRDAAQANNQAVCITTVVLDSDDKVVETRTLRTGPPWTIASPQPPASPGMSASPAQGIENGTATQAATGSGGSTSIGMVAGIAAGVAVAALAALATAWFVYRRRRQNRQAADADDWLKKDDVTAAAVAAEIGAGGLAAEPRPKSYGTPPPSVTPTASGVRFVVPGEELATLPTVQEPLCDDTLATVPTRPGGPSPATLASLVAGAPVVGLQDAQRTAQPRAYPTHDGSLAGSTPASCPATQPGTPSPANARALGAPSSLISTNAQDLASDPLMAYIRSNLSGYAASGTSQLSRASGATPRSHGSGPVGMSSWELCFTDLTILRPLGEGSFARVYLALWHETEVACKVLLAGGSRAAIASSGDAGQALALASPILQKLEEEAGLLAALRHPNVIQFFGICHDPPCFITEYCSRGSLYDVLCRAWQDEAAAAEMTWPRRLSLALGAAKGMLFLHARPTAVLHRDLKSPNLLVTDDWLVKVTDFNLSKLIEDSTKTTSSLAAMNPRWLAPEVLRGGHASRAADVYSFGIVLWELLTWKLPFPAINPWALAGMVMNGGRPEVPPREELPGPGAATFRGLGAYIQLMEDCWAQDPQDRPSFEDIVPRLRELQDDAEGGAV